MGYRECPGKECRRSANQQRSPDNAVGHSSVGRTPKAVNDPSEVDGGSALSDIGIASVVLRQSGKWRTVTASMPRCQAIAAADQRVSADSKIARPSTATPRVSTVPTFTVPASNPVVA
ncbi:hypothetical protein [Burkholderia pyrrocinia]|uniref:hypothetical protein n=1 Tax=Burkholderia pyrrocinia TaxID=60550 RepID=UPI00158A8EDD|nr:hypothetical protein [Burkholderia pyrrocinia]